MNKVNRIGCGVLGLLAAFAFTGFRSVRVAPGDEVALSGYDAVVYYAEEKATAGHPSLSYDWKGARWYFASATHLALFKKHPEMFMPAFGGYCAYGMSKGKVVAGIDPRNFVVYKNRVYFFHDEVLLKQWHTDREKFIHDASKIWEKLIEQQRIAEEPGKK